MSRRRNAGGIVLGDIGGTNARFALLNEGVLSPSEWYSVSAFPTASAALARFIAKQHLTVSRAILAAAGPVDRNRVELTNSPWVVDGSQLARELGLASVTVINDFAAVAWALPELGPDDLLSLGRGAAVSGGPAVALGPGTGLGLACVVPTPNGPQVVATEGGHATLAANNPREDAVIAWLRNRWGHVSAERVLSGQGLVNLYDAVAALDATPGRPCNPEEITAQALEGSCPTCVAALTMFCGFLGSFAGNAALMLGATGGIFIAGGIAPRIIQFLASSPFRERFEDKGRYLAYLASVPTSVILHPDPAFLGLRTLAKRDS